MSVPAPARERAATSGGYQLARRGTIAGTRPVRSGWQPGTE